MAEHEQVPTIVDNEQFAVRDKHFQEMAIRYRHDLVIAAHHDQGVMLHEWQEGRARPAEHCQQLIEITGL